jgi:hypothetical protein
VLANPCFHPAHTGAKVCDPRVLASNKLFARTLRIFRQTLLAKREIKRRRRRTKKKKKQKQKSR